MSMTSSSSTSEASVTAAPTPTLSSRALAPHERISSLADLSDDILAELCTYLPPRDVVALSSTCRRLHGIGKDPVLWSELVKRDFRSPLRLRDPTIGRILTSLRTLSSKRPGLASPPRNNNTELASPGKSPGHAAGHPGGVRWFSSRRLPPAGASVAGESGVGTGSSSSSGAPGSGTALQKYAQLYKLHRADFTAKRDVAEQTAEDLTLAQKRLGLRRFLDCCQFGVGLACLPWLVTAWLVLLALRTGGAVPNLPWVAVWVPVIAAILLPALMGCVALCTKAASSRRNSACWHQSDGDSYNAPYYCGLVLDYDAPGVCCKPLRLFLVASTYFLLLLAPILILLKLEAIITGSWAVVLLPLWILLPFVPVCGPMIGLFPTAEDSGERFKACLFLTVPLGLALCTLAMAASTLNGKTIAMGFTMLPMLIFWLMLAASAVMACLKWRSNRGTEDGRTMCGVSISLACIAAAGFSGMLIADIYWDRFEYEIVARGLVIPAIIIAVVASLACCRLTLAFLSAAREDAFRALYTQRWWNVQRAVAANMPAGHGVAAAMQAVRNDLV